MNTSQKTFLTQGMPPTVFLHGFSGEGDGLRLFADDYSGKNAICINMPGFGGAAAPSSGTSNDIRMYCVDVWQQIRKAVPAGPVNLVGHSHGAMIGYVLAVQHPDEVARLDLFCPVAMPRLLPRLAIGFLRSLQRLGVSDSLVIRLVAHPFLVSLVTRYSFQADWSSESRRRVAQMRRQEAQFYSPVMLDLMEQTVAFMRVMDGSYCQVPTRICHVADENVAGDNDYKWYQTRANVIKTQKITGGHLCVVANPERVVQLFGTERSA